MDREQLLYEMENKQFAENNGKIIRVINMLSPAYASLKRLKECIFEDISEREYLDSISFLSKEGYLDLRRIEGEEPCSLANVDYKEIEVCLSGKGIRFIHSKKPDECIEMR